MSRTTRAAILLVFLPLSALLLLYWWWSHRFEGEAPPAFIDLPPVSSAPRAITEAVGHDLKRIEGIGPKISDLLRGAGIATFSRLAATDAARLKEILTEAKIRLADPSTWPEQAALAAAGEWGALERLQAELKGGRRV